MRMMAKFSDVTSQQTNFDSGEIKIGLKGRTLKLTILPPRERERERERDDRD